MAELYVDAVAADRRVWEGAAVGVIARTTEGDVGVLAGHEPFLALLVPCVVEITTPDGRREILSVDGGFLSVADNRVAILSQYGQLAREISVDGAEKELAEAEKRLNAGDVDEVTRHHYNQATAQLRAARRAQAENN